jgi:hypothetical protein
MAMTRIRGLEFAKLAWNWEPHSPGQRDWILCNARIKVAACGRRWGKSESTAIDIALYAAEHSGTTQIVVAPTHDQTTIILDEVRRRLHQVVGSDFWLEDKRSPYPLLRFGRDGPRALPTTVFGRTAGLDGRGLRGRSAHRVIVDEAAYVPDPVMDSVITPLLADRDGKLILISTPAGRNHFWRSFLLGRDNVQSRCRSFQFPSSANPFLSRDYLAHEQAVKPERTFRVEYLAEFADAEGTVFRNVKECCSGTWQEPFPQHVYVGGLDLARLSDYSVLTIIDRQNNRVVHQERFQRISWPQQRERVRLALRRYNGAEALVEANSVGDPTIDDLRREGALVRGFSTTAQTKRDLIDALAVAFENGAIALPAEVYCKPMIDELLEYAYDLSPSGMLRSSAPAGGHDDIVMSLALAWHMAHKVTQRAVRTAGRRYT